MCCVYATSGVNLLAVCITFGYNASPRNNTYMQTAAEVLIWAIVIHLFADWLLQTDWMATYKMNLRSPAGWVHSGIHAVMLLLVFPWPAALLAGISHLLIDTRVPVHWWMRNVKHMREGPHVFTVEIWVDQVFHITVLAILSLIFFR
jgi:Kef-type K+ transport system membrane component KefB